MIGVPDCGAKLRRKTVSRMRTRALQPKGRKLVTPSTPAADYQAVAAADGSTSGSTNAHTGTDTGTVKTSRPLVKISRPLVKISRPLVKISRPLVKKYRREIFTRGRDVVRPLVCPLVLPTHENSVLKISELSARCKRCHHLRNLQILLSIIGCPPMAFRERIPSFG